MRRRLFVCGPYESRKLMRDPHHMDGQHSGKSEICESG
jgi:hypothetical protein